MRKCNNSTVMRRASTIVSSANKCKQHQMGRAFSFEVSREGRVLYRCGAAWRFDAGCRTGHCDSSAALARTTTTSARRVQGSTCRTSAGQRTAGRQARCSLPRAPGTVRQPGRDCASALVERARPVLVERARPALVERAHQSWSREHVRPRRESNISPRSESTSARVQRPHQP